MLLDYIESATLYLGSGTQEVTNLLI
uniref:Uncharacterized protein n=1 Tax=Arundo donax TaxID=35708 RepID=A0A0A9A9R9_ARUDO